MFNLFKSNKDKKLEATCKQAIIWHSACMMGVDGKLLEEPRPKVGAILFFSGSIDFLCQSAEIDDVTFFELAIELLEIWGFPKEITAPILKNFYSNQQKSEFAFYANIEGGKKIRTFLSEENEIAPLAFEAFIREWAENPDLKAEEVFLFE